MREPLTRIFGSLLLIPALGCGTAAAQTLPPISNPPSEMPPILMIAPEDGEIRDWGLLRDLEGYYYVPEDRRYIAFKWLEFNRVLEAENFDANSTWRFQIRRANDGQLHIFTVEDDGSLSGGQEFRITADGSVEWNVMGQIARWQRHGRRGLRLIVSDSEGMVSRRDILPITEAVFTERRAAMSQPRPDDGTPIVTGPRIALVVGIGRYGRLGNLANPTSDARLIATSLRSLGFNVELVLDPDLRRLRQAIQQLGRRTHEAGPNTTALFYFAGHGLQWQGNNYLLPADAEIQVEADLELEGVRADTVLFHTQSANASTSIMILDACRNAPILRSTRAPVRGLARMNIPNGSFISYSTAPGAVAVDGEGHNSPFAAALAHQMRLPNQKIEDVFRQVRRAVLNATNGEQTPWDSSSLLDPFYFKLPSS